MPDRALADSLVGQAQATAQKLPADVAGLAAEVPVIGGDSPPSREELLAVEPDFVYSPTTYEFTAEQGFASIEQLADAGVAAYTATGGCFDRRMEGTVDDLFIDLDNLGAIFHVEKEANDLISSSQAELATVDTAIEGQDRPRVAQVFVEGTTLTAIGGGIEYDILQRAGADNVFSPDDPAFADFFAAEITPESPRRRSTRCTRVRGDRLRAGGRCPLVPRSDLPGHARRARRATDRGALDRPVPRHARQRLGGAADRRGALPRRGLRLTRTGDTSGSVIPEVSPSKCSRGVASDRSRPERGVQISYTSRR